MNILEYDQVDPHGVLEMAIIVIRVGLLGQPQDFLLLSIG